MTRRAASDPAPADAPLMTAKDVMARLGVRRTFVTEHLAELGAIRVGNRLRFAPSDIDAYLDRRRVRPVAAVPAPAPIRRPAVLKHTTELNPLDNLPWSQADARRAGQGR